MGMNKIRNVVLVAGAAGAILLASAAGGYFTRPGDKTVRLFSGKASANSSKPAPPLPTATADMDQAINSDPNLEAAASLIDLDNGKEYDAGEYTYVFKAASTAKLVAVIDYLHEVEQGKASLNQDIDGTQAQEQL